MLHSSQDRNEVPDSEGLRRVQALPRRDWRDYPIQELISLLTDALKTPAGTQTLRELQAVALLELHDFGGLFAPIQVGGGKTLTSLLAPVVVGAKRPALIVPASLRDKTRREAREYARHWHLPPVNIQSYQTLSRTSGEEWLRKKAPDLLILDECHYAKNTRAAVTRKITRYLRQNPHTRVVAMSGTAMYRSLMDCWHILHWTLRDNAPVPSDWREAMAWCQALDSKVPDETRLAPGPLLDLGEHDTHGTPVEQARQAFGDRLYSTPGVVLAQGGRPENGLEITGTVLDLPDLEPHFHTLREDWETPDGHPFEDAMTLWRHARELVCGFYYVWDPRPPRSWLEARKAHSAFVREVLANSRSLDSPLQVVQAIERGKIDDGGLYRVWTSVKPTFRPNSVANWEDTTTLEYAAEWLEREQGICWVEHRAFGQALAEYTGIPHFQEKGLDPKTRTLIDSRKGPAIAQAKPCSTGFNLQHNHHKNLIVSCEPTGKQAEQLIGRTHREGQPEDTVYVEYVLGCKEQFAGLNQSIRDARFASLSAPCEQKLAYATLDLPTTLPGGYLWR